MEVEQMRQFKTELRSYLLQHNFHSVDEYLPVTVAERSKACTVFVRSKAGIVVSNPTQGMDVWCVCARVRVCAFFCVCVQVETLR
jgi:hypothetical protein